MFNLALFCVNKTPFCVGSTKRIPFHSRDDVFMYEYFETSSTKSLTNIVLPDKVRGFHITAPIAGKSSLDVCS